MGQLEDMSDDVDQLKAKLDALLDHLGVEIELVCPDWDAYRKDGTPLVNVHWEVRPKEGKK